uniref:Uncharacterized protein n=1 Tax=Romanomermis culicivorax TaxID=13658 RepID=A0A915JPQ0_ROMCU
MNAKIGNMEVEHRLQKDEEATPAVEQKAMEPPSLMKVDNDIATHKLVIDKNVVDTPDSEMADKIFDMSSVGKVAKASQRNTQL